MGRTQSNQGCSSASLYSSSHPVADSGTFLIRVMQTHKWTRFNNPPASRADVFEDGRESVSGSISTWNMISDGRLAALCLNSAKEANVWRLLSLLLPHCLLPDHPFGWSGFIGCRNAVSQCLEASVDEWGAIRWGFPESCGIPVERCRRRDGGCH